MLLIECPYCGPRDEVEFHYGGQAHVAYPENPHELSDREWAEFLFYRDNPKGPYAERWNHGVGCRKWFNAVRDTATYEFLAVYRMGEARPELPATSAGHIADAPPQSAEAAASPGTTAPTQPSQAGSPSQASQPSQADSPSQPSAPGAPNQPAPHGGDRA